LELQGKNPHKWFIFIHTDTMILWDNMLFWLNHFDPKKELYFGSPVYGDSGEYAHGGAGYVLSYAALKIFQEEELPLLEGKSRFPSQFGIDTSTVSNGEVAVAQVLKSREVFMRGYSPLFNEKSINSISYQDGVWCEPVLTLHGMDPEEMQLSFDYIEGWKEESSSNYERPMLSRDLFFSFEKKLSMTRQSWQGFEPDGQMVADKEAYTFENIDQCRSFCQADKQCMQFELYNGTCAYLHGIQWGKSAGSDITSGWKMGRLKEWAKHRRCAKSHWVTQFPPWTGEQGYVEDSS